MTERQQDPAEAAARAPLRSDEHRETSSDELITPADDAGAREVYQTRVAGPAGEQVIRSEHVSVPSEAARQRARAARVTQAVYFIFGVIGVLLLLRFALLLLGAQEASAFVGLVYSASRPFVLPFQGIFNDPSMAGSVLEWASLVGIAVYALVAYGLARLAALIYAPPQMPVGRPR